MRQRSQCATDFRRKGFGKHACEIRRNRKRNTAWQRERAFLATLNFDQFVEHYLSNGRRRNFRGVSHTSARLIGDCKKMECGALPRPAMSNAAAQRLVPGGSKLPPCIP